MKLKSLICIVLLIALSVQLCACAQETEKPSVQALAVQGNGTVDLMANVQPLSVSVQNVDDAYSVAAANFAVSLLQNSYEGENCILSAYSVYTALAMTANGADGQTLAQMESVLGMSAAELNVYLYALAKNAGSELNSANSIWLRKAEDLSVNADFLQINADYFGADAFAADFDAQTLADINEWINDHTNGMIENALDRIDPTTMLYLINALQFDASWLTAYHSGQIFDGIFYAENGEQTVQMMSSEEGKYLNDGNAVGFMKPYAGEQYSYVALMPNEGISMQEYLATLTGESLLATVRNATDITVFATMPKYEASCSTDLSETLCKMGMTDAFTDGADFSRMSNQDLMISRVLHRTKLNVDELGTQAGASTIVILDTKGFIMNSETVVLNRPFVMGIFDRVNQCFVFLGTVDSVN